MDRAKIEANFPSELIDRPQWVAWSAKKVPINPKTGEAADSTDPKTWGTFEEACKLVDSDPRAIGIGYVFAKDDPYFGIDLDGAVEDGVASDAAEAVLKKMPNAYAELSPSGKGLHIIAAGRLPTERGGANSKKVHGAEIYQHSRYFTVTGDVFRDRRCSVFVPTYQDEAIAFWHSWNSSEDRSGGLIDNKTRVELCWKTVENLPDAIQGEKGSDKFLHAVCEMFRWGLRERDVLTLARRYSREKSTPPWPEDQIRHKIDSAFNKVLEAGEFACRILALRGFDESFADKAPYEMWSGSLDKELERLKRREKWPLINVGFPEIYLMPGELTGIVAGPGVGKTTLAIQMMTYALKADPNLKCLFLEAEMDTTALVNRQLGMLSGVPAERVQFRADLLTDNDLDSLSDTAAVLKSVNDRLATVKRPATFERLARAVSAMKPNIVVIDYVQRVRDPRAKDSREAVMAAMESCRQLADQGIAVLIISASNDRMSGYKQMGMGSFRDSSEGEYGMGFAYGITWDKENKRLNVTHIKSRFGQMYGEFSLDRGDSLLAFRTVDGIEDYKSQELGE